MELESFVLAKLPFEVEKHDAVTIHVISSKIYVLRITSSKHISLYSFDETVNKENFFQLIWRYETLCDCAVVSNDGYLFVKYLDDRFCMYSIKECNVEEVWQLLLHQFKELLDTVEFGTCDLKVTPVIFTQGVLIICLNKQWLLTIDGLSSKPNVIACLKIESVVSSCIANKEFVFSMTVEGALFVHKITDGKFVQKIDMWNWLPWRESYRLLDITEEPNSLLALLDPSNTVYLFDLSSALSGMNNIKFDDSQSISSASSGVSYKTKSSFSSISRTSSVAGSVISRQLGMRYKAADDLWFSYLEKLKKTQNKAEKRLSSSTMKLERGPEDMVVHKVTFTDVGLSVMYKSRTSHSGGLYRLFNTENGQQGFSTVIPEGYHVLPLRAPSVTLDIFVLQNSLCLPLFEAPKHSFINKMLQCIDSRCIRILFEGWEELLHPPALLQAALTEGQLDKVHLVLNLHSHLFKLEIVGDGLEGIHTKDILDKLMEVTNSSTATEQFIRQVRGLQLTHSYRLLGILDEVNIPTNLQSEVAVIRNQIMGSIVAARAGLENGVEGLAPVPPEHSVEWVLWEGMSDMDVVRVGVARLSAVQCFLAVQRGWTPEELSGPKFKEVVLGSALHLLEKRDVEGASHLISVTGFNAKEELRKICLNSLNKNLVDFMIESLTDLWTENELQAWEFLNLITAVVQRCKYLVHEKNIEEILQLSLIGIMSITDDKKQDIITELYFRTWDESLSVKLKKEDCWRHLIENNCVEGLQVWLDLKQPPYQFPWPINLFGQWNITQEMIDSINDFVCTECTKEIIFNCLSMKGLFCTESKKNPQKVLKRLAGTKSLLDIENIINSTLSDNFLSFICDYNLTNFAVILHKQIPSLLSLSSFRHQRHTTKWMDLWQSFIDVEGVWEDNTILEVIQRTTDFVSNGSQDSYKRDHPLVSVAVALNQNKSLLEICNDPLTISPLLAISMPLDKTDDRRETTLYSLLSGTTAFHTDTLFQWHNDSTKSLPKGVEPIFPHFSNEKLSIQYGHKQCLTYLDHLKQGRPCFAFVQFFHEISNVQGCIPTRMQKRGTNIAHGLALEYFKDKDIGCSCVVFTELLSRDSTPLRIHLACIDAIFNAEFECGTSDLRNILHGIVMNKQESAENLMKILEEALHPQLQELCGHNKIACLRLWQLPVLLANLHQLSLPESLLLHGAENNNWLLFVTVICLFNYPKWQVMQLIKKFSSDAFQEHFTYALQLKVDNQGHYNTSVSSSRLTQSFITSDKLFPCVAEHGNIPERLLLQARAQRCSGFALLATCFQSRNLIACFSEWLAAGLPTGYESVLPSNPMDWSSSHVSHLLEIVVGLSYINSLHHVLSIFFPTNPLHIFSKFLLNTVEEKKFVESSFNVELFKESLSSLSENEQDFLFSKMWVSKTIVKLCSVALIKCFPAYSQQHLFLLTICNSALVTQLPVTVEGPDFLLLLNLTECLSEYGLTLDYTLICEEDYEHFSFDKQLLKLINSHKFSVAHQFATIAGLQHYKILIVEWKEKAKVKSDAVCIRKFWESCDAAFIEGSLPPDDAVLFYTEQADLSNSTQERCITLKYALKWIGLKPSNDTTKYQELSVLYSLYLSFLQDDFNIELAVEDLCFKPLKCFRKDVVSPATLDWFKQKSVTSLKTSEMDRLDALLKKLLEFGDLSTVWCLEALFKYKIKDSLILDGCLGLAEGQFSVDDMPENIAQILSEGISSLRASISSEPFASSSLNLSHSFSSNYSFVEDFEEINTEENQETEGKLKVINSLVDSATCCTRLVQYIQSALRIAKKFNMQYKDVIEMENPLVLIEKSCDSLHVAKDVIILANLPADQTVFYLCSQIVKAVNSSEKWFSGNGELTDLLSLAEDPLRLGKLLTAAASLTQPESFNQTAELLILAHSCFTRACNMEGISKVLKMCQKLTEVLHENFQWSLMVRLLTGIGRYTEMRYIFHLLKVNQQFECLLSKGLDKYSGLKSATLEFVRGDKELFTLVALHFRMYSELAAMFEEIASTYLDGLEFVDDGKILHNDHNVQNLQAAIKAYTHTAQHYIQGKKLKRATNVVNQAELATLQLSFLCTVEKGQLAVSLLRLQLPQVTSLITNTLNYEEACIVAQAYNVSVEWSSALYQQFIVKGNQQYLTAWSRHHDLNYTTVQDIVRRFQQEKTLSDLMVKNMKQFIHVIKYTDLKYRVSSQIGFKDVLQTLLSGPELPYLKDTVWQSGFKKQHL